MNEIDSYAIEEYFLNKAEEELAMSEKDRCLQVAEEQELKLRMKDRLIGIYEEEINELKGELHLQDGQIEDLKKEKRILQIQLERGIS